MAVTRRYRLNLRNYGNPPIIMISQYDEGYNLVFDIYDGVTAADDLSAYTVKLRGVRYDTLSYEFTGTISTNVLSFTIDTTMSACAGRGTAEIAILDTDNNVEFATFNLLVYVEKAAVPDDAIDADVERAEEIAAQVQTIVDTAAETVTQSIADAYSSSSTYAVGDYCIYNNTLYRCTTAIATAEAWTSGHWTAVTAGDELSLVKSDLNAVGEVIEYGRKRIQGAYITSGGVIDSNASYDLICIRLPHNGILEKLESATALVYAFYTSEPSLGSVSYNNSRTVLSSDKKTYNLSVPTGCKWIAVRVSTGADITVFPNNIIESIQRDIAKLQIGDQVYTFKIGNYTFTYGNVPTYVSTNKNRFCIDGYIFIRNGETISTKWSNISFLVAICNKDGIYLSSNGTYVSTYTATADTYAYIVFKRDSINDFTVGNWLESSAYFFHKFRQSDSLWNGKTWYSFGTSMSDINTDGTTGNNGTLGKWPLIVDELSGATRTNKAIGGGGIVPSAGHGGNVKANIMQCPYDVDLVTFECGLNDWGSITLGEIGDKSDDTFIGNFTQCIEYLTYNTRAKIVLVTMIPLTYSDYSAGTRRDVFFENSFGYTYREYVDAMIEVCHYYGVAVIDAQANAMSNGRCNKDTIIDSTHFKDLGGEIYGRYVWSQLKDILPLPKFPNNY